MPQSEPANFHSSSPSFLARSNYTCEIWGPNTLPISDQVRGQTQLPQAVSAVLCKSQPISYTRGSDKDSGTLQSPGLVQVLGYNLTDDT